MKLPRVLNWCLVSIVWLLTPMTIFAQGGTQAALQGLEDSRSGLPNIGGGSIPTLIGNWLAIILGFTGTIFFILVVWAGLTWMTAAGNQENIKKAQDILKTAIIGLIIVLSAYAITRFIGTSLLGS